MLPGAASFQHTPSAQTIPLSRSQVCIRKLSSSCKFYRFVGLGIGPFARSKYKAPLVSRAEFSTHSCQTQSTPSSQKFKAERSFSKGTQRQDLQSLKGTPKQKTLDYGLHSYNEIPSQGLQRLKGFRDQHAEAQPKRDVGLEQQRLPKTEPGYPARNQPADAQSSAAPSKSSTFSPNRNRHVHPSKRRSSRAPARGLDVLDELMASQGRSSRALLESLQSTEASDNDDMPHVHSHEKDSPPHSFSGKVPRNKIVEGKYGSMSRVLSNFRKIDTGKPTYNTMTDNAVTASTFASSIEKALSPSGAPKAIGATGSTLSSSTKVCVLEQRSSTSSSEAYSGVSDVAKPSLQGQEVLLALQKAAVEKAKQKQRTRKVSERASKSNEVALLRDSGEWRNAKPIAVKPEWALQIDELEHRIENLKNPMPSS